MISNVAAGSRGCSVRGLTIADAGAFTAVMNRPAGRKAGLATPGATDRESDEPSFTAPFTPGSDRPLTNAHPAEDGKPSFIGSSGRSPVAKVEQLAWCVHDRKAAIGCALDVGGSVVNVVVAATGGMLSVTLVSDGRVPAATMQAAATAVRRMYPEARVSCRREGRR